MPKVSKRLMNDKVNLFNGEFGIEYLGEKGRTKASQVAL